jgi:hypothetical protein
MRKFFLLISFSLLAVLLFAQEREHQPASQGDLEATTQAMGHGHHHEGHDAMGAHMYMTELRAAQPGDQEKAQKIVEQARQSLEKYRDYKAALSDGFKIFLPNVPQKMYHFTSMKYAIGASFGFDATKPTSLLYEKNGDDYKLVGAMYTAPVRFGEDQINERVPLSMAQWHQHVNMCKPPKGQEMEQLSKNAKFGLRGSISTQPECEAAGGTFMPHVFGWMVHMYPWEKTPDEIWSVERQLKDKPGMDHHDHGDMAGMEHKH